VTPYVKLTHITHPAQRWFGSSKRQLKLLVAIQLGHPPIVVILCGSNFPSCPAPPEGPKEYRSAAPPHKLRTGMCQEEYIDAINYILDQRRIRG
jgi:hypothetical protein